MQKYAEQSAEYLYGPSRHSLKSTLTLRLATAALLIASFSSMAQSALAYHEPRTVSGTILVGNPYYIHTSLAADQPRCAWLLRGEESQGRVGYMVELRFHAAPGTHSSFPLTPPTRHIPTTVFFLGVGFQVSTDTWGRQHLSSYSTNCVLGLKLGISGVKI